MGNQGSLLGWYWGQLRHQGLMDLSASKASICQNGISQVADSCAPVSRSEHGRCRPRCVDNCFTARRPCGGCGLGSWKPAARHHELELLCFAHALPLHSSTGPDAFLQGPLRQLAYLLQASRRRQARRCAPSSEHPRLPPLEEVPLQPLRAAHLRCAAVLLGPRLLLLVSPRNPS